MRTKFHWTQYLVGFEKRQQLKLDIYLQGVFVCCIGLGLLVGSDQIQSEGGPGLSFVKGDMLMIAAATCYGFSEYPSDIIDYF